MAINSDNYRYKIGGTPPNSADVTSPEDGIDKTGLNLNVAAFQMENIKREMVKNDPVLQQFKGTSFVNPAYIQQPQPTITPPKKDIPPKPEDDKPAPTQNPTMPAGIIEPVNKIPVAQFLKTPTDCMAEMKLVQKVDLGDRNKYIFQDVAGSCWYVNVIKNGRMRDVRFSELIVGESYLLKSIQVIPTQGGDPFNVIDIWKG